MVCGVPRLGETECVVVLVWAPRHISLKICLDKSSPSFGEIWLPHSPVELTHSRGVYQLAINQEREITLIVTE